MLDGVSNMDTYNLLTAPFPNSDATQEFKVITNNFSAQYGFAPGAVVSIASKSGTNSFHGGAFWFVRNNDLNAGDWFSHQVDALKRNQFGAYAGGPIQRNKLFFFGNYQGTRMVWAPTNLRTTTPTAAMLNGDFSGLSPDGVTTNLVGPFKSIGGKPNQLDTGIASLDAAAVTITRTGLPGHTAGVTQTATGDMFYTQPPIHNTFDEGTAKLDYNLSPSQTLSPRSFTNTMTAPSTSVPGNLDTGRNAYWGPKVFTADAAIMKSWALYEGLRLQFRWEAFNVTNHPNFGNPDGSQWGSSHTGMISGLGNVPPRVMQGALKVTF